MRSNKDPQFKNLTQAIALLTSELEIYNFLRDVFSITELKEANTRFEIAKLLWLGGMSYLEIAEKLGTSTTTVTRVADWLFNKDYQGFQNVLSKLYPKSPASPH